MNFKHKYAYRFSIIDSRFSVDRKKCYMFMCECVSLTVNFDRGTVNCRILCRKAIVSSLATRQRDTEDEMKNQLH